MSGSTALIIVSRVPRKIFCSGHVARKITAHGHLGPKCGVTCSTTSSKTCIDRWIARVAQVLAKFSSVSPFGIFEARPDVRVNTTD